jgi:uncharacterized membrane protein (UPF0182 family)
LPRNSGPTIDWPPPRRRGRGRVALLAVIAAVFLGGGTALSYYVESLWFASLGFGDVFWTTLNLQAGTFAAFFLATFGILYLAFVGLKPARLEELAGGTILINGQPVTIPVAGAIRMIAIGAALIIALGSGLGMSAQWQTLALYWNAAGDLGAAAATAAETDPIFGRPLAFYFFTLPAWRLLVGWITTLALVIVLAAAALAVVGGGVRAFEARRATASLIPLRGVSVAVAALLATFAIRVYIGRFDRLYTDHTIFSGVNYTDAHVTIVGHLVVAIALAGGAIAALVSAFARPRPLVLAAAAAPAALCYLGVGVIGWYIANVVVRPNQLVRERPFITNNIELTRRAYGLHRVEQVQFPAEPGVDALEIDQNSDTLENIRLWDWRALQDTLRQIQEIRTYYEFPDIDIDRYEIGGTMRQVMLGVRELNVERLPESSRNWINEKLIYTHGYGLTMNPVNGFTAEGLPDLLLRNMPIESRVPGLTITRPEIYFGELTNTDVYVRTRQQEFNFPEGETNAVTSYEGTGGIPLGGWLRRLAIAVERGDLARLPFSDDVTADSRLLMRRNIRARVQALAPFLLFDADPYIVITDAGRLVWMIDGFTTSDSYPYSRRYMLDRTRLNYLRNSVKAVVDAYDGTVSLYVFDAEDPLIAAYRRLFPTLFRDADALPPSLRKHVRYPELLLEVQAAVYGLYHMTNPDVFYNREDLWTIASEVSTTAERETTAQTIEPNFLLMKLPGEERPEFVEMLPFTPANRNNLIGWIAGRSDDPNYGAAIVYHFPKTRLVDGPLQVEARIDQDAQLSGQLSLWNQQGSSVRRGGLIVIPMGRALLYAEPIYLQAARSPMPELRIVVLGLQDRIAYGPTFEHALDALFGRRSSALAREPGTFSARTPQAPSAAPRPGAETAGAPGTVAPADRDALIADAARDLAEYQRLTAEGRLGEAGQRLEALKQKLERLQGR